MPEAPRCDYVRVNVPIPAGVLTDIAVGINFAPNWGIILKNTGSNSITALSISSDPLGSLPEAPAVCTESLPLAAGATYPGIRGVGEPVLKVHLYLLSPLGTTVTINAAGL